MSERGELRFAGGPSLDDILADPIVRLLIKRDGWTFDAVRAAMMAAMARSTGAGGKVCLIPTGHPRDLSSDPANGALRQNVT